MSFKIGRACRLAGIFIPTAIRFYLKRDNYDDICNALIRAGPTFIKLGQWASQRPDLFTEQCTRALYPLVNHVSEHSVEYTLQTVTKEINCDKTFNKAQAVIFDAASRNRADVEERYKFYLSRLTEVNSYERQLEN